MQVCRHPKLGTITKIAQSHNRKQIPSFLSCAIQAEFHTEGGTLGFPSQNQINFYFDTACTKLNVRRRLHDSVFNTKMNIWSPFWPSVYTQTMKTHMQNEDF